MTNTSTVSTMAIKQVPSFPELVNVPEWAHLHDENIYLYFKGQEYQFPLYDIKYGSCESDFEPTPDFAPLHGDWRTFLLAKVQSEGKSRTVFLDGFLHSLGCDLNLTAEDVLKCKRDYLRKKAPDNGWMYQAHAGEWGVPIDKYGTVIPVWCIHNAPVGTFWNRGVRCHDKMRDMWSVRIVKRDANGTKCLKCLWTSNRTIFTEFYVPNTAALKEIPEVLVQVPFKGF